MTPTKTPLVLGYLGWVPAHSTGCCCSCSQEPHSPHALCRILALPMHCTGAWELNSTLGILFWGQAFESEALPEVNPSLGPWLTQFYVESDPPKPTHFAVPTGRGKVNLAAVVNTSLPSSSISRGKREGEADNRMPSPSPVCKTGASNHLPPFSTSPPCWEPRAHAPIANSYLY